MCCAASLQSCYLPQSVVLSEHAALLPSHKHTQTHSQSVRMCCVGCGRAAAVALTTVSLFSKRKAADVSRGSDRGEWNVGAIFEMNSLTHTPSPLILVSAAAVDPSVSTP